MKKGIFIFFTLFLMLFSVAVTAQECAQVDCQGRCGRFIDEDQDTYCDLGLRSEDTMQISGNDDVVNDTEVEPRAEEPQKRGDVQISDADTEAKVLNVAEEADPTPQKRYHFTQIFFATLLVYLATFLLTKLGKMKVVTHRKIWNIMLTITFLISGILGLLLTVFINHQYYPDSYMLLMRYHVEFGVAMAIISIFHMLWHLPYFKNIFKHK